MEEIITYETLYTILRQEKYKPELQKLDKDFFNKVISYLREKNQILESLEKKSDNVFAAAEIKKTKKQLDNTTRLLKELYEKRESKIIKLAMLSSRVDETQKAALLPEEQEMLYSLREKFDYYRENLLKKLLNGSMPNLPEKPKALKSEKEKEEENKCEVLVEFLDNIQSFLGLGQEKIGPFKKGEKARLHPLIANILIKTGKARK